MDKKIGIDEVNAALGMEQRLLTERYAIAIRRGLDLLGATETKRQQGKTSTHDGSNLGSVAGDLQTIAGQLEQLDSILKLSRKAAL